MYPPGRCSYLRERFDVWSRYLESERYKENVIGPKQGRRGTGFRVISMRTNAQVRSKKLAFRSEAAYVVVGQRHAATCLCSLRETDLDRNRHSKLRTVLVQRTKTYVQRQKQIPPKTAEAWLKTAASI